MWAAMHKSELAGGCRSAVAAWADFSRVVRKAWAAEFVFLEMNSMQRDAACLPLMSSGASSVVLWVLTEEGTLLPLDPELSSDRLVPLHDRSWVYVRLSNEGTTIHWTAQCIAAVWIPLAADCRRIVMGLLLVVWSSFAVDPESRLWITSWSFGIRRTKKSMALSRISPQA
jgi:hypothetical protein